MGAGAASGETCRAISGSMDAGYSFGGYLTVGAVLRLIRPRDRDGGWGWFGKALMNKGEK